MPHRPVARRTLFGISRLLLTLARLCQRIVDFIVALVNAHRDERSCTRPRRPARGDRRSQRRVHLRQACGKSSLCEFPKTPTTKRIRERPAMRTIAWSCAPRASRRCRQLKPHWRTRRNVAGTAEKAQPPDTCEISSTRATRRCLPHSPELRITIGVDASTTRKGW